MRAPYYDINKLLVAIASTARKNKQNRDPFGNSLPSLASSSLNQQYSDESSIESDFSFKEEEEEEEEEEELENEHCGRFIEFKVYSIVRDDFRIPFAIASSSSFVSPKRTTTQHHDDSEHDEWSVSLGGADYDISESRPKIPGHVLRRQRRRSMTSDSDSSIDSLKLVVSTSIHHKTDSEKNPRITRPICDSRRRRYRDSVDGTSVDSLKLA